MYLLLGLQPTPIWYPREDEPKGSTFESLPLRKEPTKQKGVEFSTPFVFVAYGASLLADIRL